jgi:hypothetical protein
MRQLNRGVPACAAFLCVTFCLAALTADVTAQEIPELSVVVDASADASGPVTFSWTDGGPLPVYGVHILGEGGKAWTGWKWSLAAADPGGTWSISWDIVFNDLAAYGAAAATGNGAFVSSVVSVTNNDIDTQRFMVSQELPLTKIIPLPGMRGEISGTIADNNFNDASIFAPENAQIYTGQIDNSDEMASYLMPYPFTASAGGPLQSGTVGPADFGYPDWVEAGSDRAQSEISLFLDFELTAGDTTALMANFEVKALPGPGGLPLLAMLGVLGIGRRRR